MYQLKIGTIPLPKLYVCITREEARECRRLGVPYLIKPEGWADEKLVKAVLWRVLAEKFPHIKWEYVLGMKRRSVYGLKVHVPIEPEEVEEIEELSLPSTVEVESDYRDNPGHDTCGFSTPQREVTADKQYRETGGGLDTQDTFSKMMKGPEYSSMGIDSYIGDLGWYVNIEELQALRVLPEFLDDIASAIKLNISNSLWMDGYNKKLGCNIGHWQGTDQAPNLIILDTSGSIPSGVAGTMVSLIETLRNQANADLIITSGRSEFWGANEELPSPDDLAYLIGGCNECVQFYNILRTKVLGKHWGNVIVFGDWDSPLRRDIDDHRAARGCPALQKTELQNTRIDRIMAFHTDIDALPGYGLWAKDAAPKAEVVYNSDWVDCMDSRY